MKTKRIEVLCGASQSNLYPSAFEVQVKHIFAIISDSKCGGGALFNISGRYQSSNDEESICMVFYCESEDLSDTLRLIEQVFKEVKPVGCKHVSVKVSDVDSYSFGI